jgi:hypothetical protein
VNIEIIADDVPLGVGGGATQQAAEKSCEILLGPARAHLYGAFFVKPLRSGSSFFFVSFFVRSEPVSSPRPTNPRRCRAQGLSRLAVAPTLPRAPIIARPHLDSSEHGSTLVVVGMTINEGSAPFAAG